MKIDPRKWRLENAVNKQLHDDGGLEDDIRRLIHQAVNPEHNTQSAKGVDAFGRTKEQVEMARLMRAGRKGIRVK